MFEIMPGSKNASGLKLKVIPSIDDLVDGTYIMSVLLCISRHGISLIFSQWLHGI